MLRDAMLDKARDLMGDIRVLAAEVAEHRRDPYTVVEEIAGKLQRSGDVGGARNVS
jgi:hypothetical protein